MTKGYVLDPVVRLKAPDNPAGPPLGPLSGKVLGLRRDIYWTSWDAVTDEWAKLAERDGAEVRYWRHYAPTGRQMEQMLSELDQFLSEVDGVVVGLSNCGACSQWVIHDALRALDKDIPTVVVSTDQFVEFNQLLANQGGRDEIRIAPLPYPLEGLPEEKIRQIARDNYESMLSYLGAEVYA
ncbi:UGSC family (seleno)protein [Novosphingobium malaysiense]|uniref:UGSC-like domain-containing protein n=1 Tax=Novosphingobium malaysiense TaxID=1348853 RepID=A0A0B1ZGW6_9SPHN|nr:hypothetical protein [Novosphingobium malaysiense]KHK90346.1 hypothetical protein LK12_17255 [Novosphingobium malaysiense]